jgi:hypothetical protein
MQHSASSSEAMQPAQAPIRAAAQLSLAKNIMFSAAGGVAGKLPFLPLRIVSGLALVTCA